MSWSRLSGNKSTKDEVDIYNGIFNFNTFDFYQIAILQDF